MAALYVKGIRSLQPHGPYLVGGYCGGGVIAYEVAQRLGGEGEEVALLALLDTMNFSNIHPPSMWSLPITPANVWHFTQPISCASTSREK